MLATQETAGGFQVQGQSLQLSKNLSKKKNLFLKFFKGLGCSSMGRVPWVPYPVPRKKKKIIILI